MMLRSLAGSVPAGAARALFASATRVSVAVESRFYSAAAAEHFRPAVSISSPSPIRRSDVVAWLQCVHLSRSSWRSRPSLWCVLHSATRRSLEPPVDVKQSSLALRYDQALAPIEWCATSTVRVLTVTGSNAPDTVELRETGSLIVQRQWQHWSHWFRRGRVVQVEPLVPTRRPCHRSALRHRRSHYLSFPTRYVHLRIVRNADRAMVFSCHSLPCCLRERGAEHCRRPTTVTPGSPAIQSAWCTCPGC